MLKPSSSSTLGFSKVCADEERRFAWRDRKNNRLLDILVGNLLEFLIEEANQSWDLLGDVITSVIVPASVANRFSIIDAVKHV